MSLLIPLALWSDCVKTLRWGRQRSSHWLSTTEPIRREYTGQGCQLKVKGCVLAFWITLSLQRTPVVQVKSYLSPFSLLCACLKVTEPAAKRVTLMNIQWGKKVFSQPPIVQVLPLKKMREACNCHHRYTSAMTDKMSEKKSRKSHCRIFYEFL